MGERKGKGTRLVEELLSHPLTEEEQAERRGPRPKLRLRPEVLTQALDTKASVRDVLARQTGEAAPALTVLRDAETGATSVAVPLDQYLELVTSSIKDADRWIAGNDGGLRPPDDDLAQLGVEQVNPDDSWTRIERVVG